MNWIGNIDALKRGIEILGGNEYDANITVKEIDKGFYLKADSGEYEIGYKTPADFYRAYCVLRNKLQKGEMDFLITQTNNFDTCGIMIDVSRNAVLKVETVKDFIRRMANMGLNMLMLYTEDTYKLDEYPYFGYMRGAYSKDELKEIVSYAKIFGIEAIPCIQTLGHLERPLKWDATSEIKDTNSVLMVDEEKTYDLIEAMIKNMRECFDTDKIHIGMDETYGLGLGQYFKKHGYEDAKTIYLRHLARVGEIVKKYDFKPMMWSDMIFGMAKGSENYYDKDAIIPDDFHESLPEDITLVYWDYYSCSKEIYDAMIKNHQKFKRDLAFAGGVWTWSGPSWHGDETFTTTNLALPSCIEHGIKNVFTTMWGDDGAECSAYEALLGLQLYAEYNYSENPMETLDDMFKICTGYDAEAFRLFDCDSFDDERVERHNALVTKQAFYQDILQGLFDKNFAALDLKTHYKEILEKLEKISPQGDLEYLFDYHKLFVKILTSKCDIGIRLTKAYLDKDANALSNIADELGVLQTDYKALHEKAAYIWYKNNKPFGFEAWDFRLGGMETRISRAEKRIREYLAGTIETISELEEERLWYGKEEQPFYDTYFFSRMFNC